MFVRVIINDTRDRVITSEKRKNETRTYIYIYYPELRSKGINNFLYPETGGRGGDLFRRDASGLGVSFPMPHLDGAYA